MLRSRHHRSDPPTVTAQITAAVTLRATGTDHHPRAGPIRQAISMLVVRVRNTTRTRVGRSQGEAARVATCLATLALSTLPLRVSTAPDGRSGPMTCSSPTGVPSGWARFMAVGSISSMRIRAATVVPTGTATSRLDMPCRTVVDARGVDMRSSMVLDRRSVRLGPKCDPSYDDSMGVGFDGT